MIAADITAYLASKGHGTPGSNLFTDDMPADPDTITVIYEYPGSSSFWVRDDGNPVLERPRLQLSVRGTSYMDVANRAEAAHAELLGITNATINDVRYGHVRHLQDGWLKTRDDRNRFLWQRNYEAIREAVTQSV